MHLPKHSSRTSSYAVVHSISASGFPALLLLRLQDAQPGSGIWSVPSSPADQQQQQQQLPLQGLTTPRLVPTGIVNVVPSANTTAQRADLLVDTEEAARRAHQLYCTWTKPGPLSLIPQLTPILAALLAAVISSRWGWFDSMACWTALSLSMQGLKLHSLLSFHAKQCSGADRLLTCLSLLLAQSAWHSTSS